MRPHQSHHRNSRVAPGCDVANVGAGYTGLSAGLTLAGAGRSVQSFDRERLGAGASSRNGPIASGNLRASHSQLERKFGETRATALATEAKAAREDLALFIKQEGIACDFKVSGRFTGAAPDAARCAGGPRTGGEDLLIETQLLEPSRK